MALHVNCNLKSLDTFEHKNGLHLMPCLIKADGPANVSQYFKPVVDGLKYYRASFRGRPLRGQTVAVPSGFKGIVLQERKQPLVENVERNLHVARVFDEVTYWNWDAFPSPNDAFFKALDWIDIAHALHAPDEESLEIKEDAV